MKNKSVFETVGERIRALRKAAGLSQERLAERAGLHYTYIGAVERAERNVTLDTLVRIANGLGVAVGDFFPSTNATRSAQVARILAGLELSDDQVVDAVGELVTRLSRRKKRSSHARSKRP
jgi:transcriptional regulator with XRE-family HTH domain